GSLVGFAVKSWSRVPPCTMKNTRRSPPETRMVLSGTKASEPNGNTVCARATAAGRYPASAGLRLPTLPFRSSTGNTVSSVGAGAGGAEIADPAVQVVDLEHVQLVGDGRFGEDEVERQIDRALAGHAEDLDVRDRHEVGTLELHRARILIPADRQARERRHRWV